MLCVDIGSCEREAAAVDAGDSGGDAWRASSGSAAVLGLRRLRMAVAPTTAYLMLGERCARDCTFCTQARSSRADAAALSRVIWPEFPAAQLRGALARAYRERKIERTCFQVTVSSHYLARARQAVAALASASDVPICVSIAPRSEDDVAALLAAGAERVTIALDAACERVHQQVKSGDWHRTWELLETAASHFAGRIGTHLIVGLGESEREMVDCIQRVVDRGIHLALFAFTPVEGTAMAAADPPCLARYRRMQVARWLLFHRHGHATRFRYTADRGLLCDYGIAESRLRDLLASGDAFRTSGCPGCNRPYYNERPGGVLYNYPRPLGAAEATQEVEALLATLVCGGV